MEDAEDPKVINLINHPLYLLHFLSNLYIHLLYSVKTTHLGTTLMLRKLHCNAKYVDHYVSMTGSRKFI